MEKILMQAEKIPENQGDILEVCVIPEGKFIEKDWFGKKRQIGYDEASIKQMVGNWEKKILHYDPILNISHEDKICGEVQELFAIFDDEVKQEGLWAKIKLNETGQDLLDKQMYRYISPEIYHGYLDADGNDHGYVFAGVALTNYPRHKRIKKLNFSELAQWMFEKFVGGEDTEIEVETMAEERVDVEKFESMQKEIEQYKLQEQQLRVDKWVAEMKPEGYTPAVLNRFHALLVDGKMDFELATELIKMTEKVATEQVVANFTKEVHEVSLEELGRMENSKFTENGVNKDA